jgi:asparagine synthase (glutamine-hydrolysing)
MCGIAGILNTRQPVDLDVLRQMCDALRHRGPDDEGYYIAPGVGLGQRRLSIVDLATGHQPLANEDGSVWVTFNGEIYNFQELRRRLEGLGHRFATHSDTEVLVHAYEQYGPECVRHLRGMFAFALWDGHRQTLLLARDRVGKKPLFYTTAGDEVVFASELQGLLRHPGVRRELDPTALDEYLTYGYVPAPRSGFRGIHKLPPAHYLTASRSQSGDGIELRAERYWRLEHGPKLAVGVEEAAEGLLEVLTEAVRLRQIADVPLGALLSGGIDSSLVVALMSQVSDRPVRTFSIGFEEQEFNELPYARLVAQRFGTEHHEFIVRPDAVEVLPTLVRHYGEPYADSSALPSYYVARLTRQHVTVALNGDGGDENFAGYERYLGSLLADHYRRLPALVREGLVRPVAALIPETLSRRSRLQQAKRFLQAAGLPPAARYLRWVNCFPAEARQRLYTPDFRQALDGADAEAWLALLFEDARGAGLGRLDTLLEVDRQSYLPYDLLVKMDVATMANSLEARSPFLDHKVMEYAARLPDRLKVRGRSLKYLLKVVGRRLLPLEILGRRKMGFGVPVGAWMRAGLGRFLEDILLSPGARTRAYLRPEAVRHLLDAHRQGQRDCSGQLWALLCLELWQREFLS